MRVRCPECDHKQKVPDDYDRPTIRCSECEAKIRLPEPEEDEPRAKRRSDDGDAISTRPPVRKRPRDDEDEEEEDRPRRRRREEDDEPRLPRKTWKKKSSKAFGFASSTFSRVDYKLWIIGGISIFSLLLACI